MTAARLGLDHRGRPARPSSLASELVVLGVRSDLANVIGDAVRRLRSLEDDLENAARSLAERMDRLVDTIHAGYHVNELGEVQGRGGEVDRLCALRQAAIDNVKIVRSALGTNEPAKVLVNEFAFGPTGAL
jgi:hypothetical protein